MAVLFDPADEYVRSVLDRAKVQGEITLADLESIVETSIEAKGRMVPDDIRDTTDALAGMGIEIDNGLTREQEDAQFLRSMRARVARGDHLPSFTAEGFARLARAIHRQETAPPDPAKAAEDEAVTREVLSKRAFIQNMFVALSPRVRRTRPRIK